MQKPVQGLWLGPSLSFIEQLSIQSFMDHGHPYHLYVYDEVEGVPAGCKVCDASKVLPREEVFYRKKTMLGAFSDYFRWRLLYEGGGLWADLDVICLKPVTLDDEMLFGDEGEAGWVGTAFLGFDRDNPFAALMLRICEDVNAFLPFDTPPALLKKAVRRTIFGLKKSREITRFAEPGGPAYMTRHLDYYDLRRLAKPPQYFYPVPYPRWRDILLPAAEIWPRLEGSYCVHLWNSILGADKSIDKARLALAGTVLEDLGIRHGLLEGGRDRRRGADRDILPGAKAAGGAA